VTNQLAEGEERNIRDEIAGRALYIQGSMGGDYSTLLKGKKVWRKNILNINYSSIKRIF
jgi:hypothetical protein